MAKRAAGSLLLSSIISWGAAEASAEVPRSVDAAWNAFDPRAEALETEVIRESLEEGIVLRCVRYVVGRFEGRKTRVAAFYAFPEGGSDLPGIVQVHGGGQFARKEMVRYYASRGYAAIAVNWGEKVIDAAGDPNTDWAGIPAGFLDPKHHNEVAASGGTLHAEAHPWNSSWLLYAAAARRAITFLERQPECDGDRIGLQGHSMGGRITVLSAVDPRLKAVSPSVGGSGYLYSDITGIPGSARRMEAGPARDLYLATIDCREYWPRISCPVMFLGATNDFNSPMEMVVRGFRSQPDPSRSRMSFTPHMNHRFTADNMAARVRWFDAQLKGAFKFPETARTRLDLETEDDVPRFVVKPDVSGPHAVDGVTIFYGFDRDPRARFWRAAEMVEQGGEYIARCPVMDLGEPLFAFANVTYETGEAIKLPAGYADTSLLTVTSEYRMAFPNQLREAGVKAVGERQRMIDDFSRGWQDWSLVSARNREHWNFETHKINDPAFVGPRGGSLAFDIVTTKPGETLAIILYADQWRGYTGRKARRYVALVSLEVPGTHAISLTVDQFTTEEGQVLSSYDFLTSLIFTPGHKERPREVKTPWQGEVPTFRRLRWEGGSLEARPRPYLGTGVAEIDADAAFQQQFEEGVRESVERERRDRE